MPRNTIKFLFQRFFRRAAAERDLQDELASHIAAEIRQRMERGESPQAARESVLREFGNVGPVAGATRDMWGFGGLEQVLQDVRYGIRMLRKSPGMTLVVTLMLALGIGGVAAIFTFVNGILLRPLAFPSPDRLVAVWEIPPKTTKQNVVAIENFAAWKQQSRSFESMAAFINLPMNLITLHASEQVPGLAVTSEFFHTLGSPPLIGRTFRPREYLREAPREVVLSYNTWQSRFGGRRDVIGKKISIDVSHHEIIGVMPPGFGLPGVDADLYVPLPVRSGEGRNYSVVARLRPGVSASAAKAEIATIAARTAKADAELNAGWSATVVPLLDQTVGSVRPILLVVFAAVCLLLLLACANIANLLLMHSSARSQEISVRLALGAGKFRIARQLLVEILLLASLGGVAGTALAVTSVYVARATLPEALHLPRLNEITVDGRVLALSIGMTMLSCILFGLAPAAQTLKRDIIRDLHSVTRSITSGRSLRNVLVVAEVAIAVVVVAAAGLLMRSFLRLTRVDAGFHAEHVLTLQMLLLPVKNPQYRAQEVDDMLKRIRVLPGVLSAGSIGILPMQGSNAGTWYYRTDRPEPAANNRPVGDVSIITPGYFSTLGIPILRGRDFNQYDRRGTPLVAIVNQTAARLFFPGENPIGKRLKVWWDDPTPVVQIVGVAHDIRHSTLSAAPDPCLFMPNDQQPISLYRPRCAHRR
jgi:putative ABC transport system permease protein